MISQPQAWYSAIAPQLLVLLDGNEGPDLVRAAAYIIGFGILGRESSGGRGRDASSHSHGQLELMSCLGTSGYRFLAEPILNPIKPPPRLLHGADTEADTDADTVIDLSKDKAVVSYDDLATALHRLHALLTGHPNPNLCRRLLPGRRP